MRDHATLNGGGTGPEQGTVTEIPDAGYASNIVNPAFFTEALRELLDGPGL